MRRLSAHCVSLLVVLTTVAALAAPAAAAVFETEVTGSLQFSNLGRVSASASGTGLATVNGPAGSLGHLNTLSARPVPDAALNTVIQVTDPIVTAGGIVEVRLTSIQARPDLQGGIFAPVSGALQNTALQLTQNTMPSTGQVRICLIEPGCEPGSTLTLDVGGTVNGEFIGGGVGGLLTIGGEGGIRISIFGAPWTLKTVSVSNRTDNGGITFFQKNGFAHGPASLTSSTAVTSGVVQIVTASQTITVGVPGNSDRSGNISAIRTYFAPEPGILLLLGAGAAGVGLLGYRRRG